MYSNNQTESELSFFGRNIEECITYKLIKDKYTSSNIIYPIDNLLENKFLKEILINSNQTEKEFKNCKLENIYPDQEDKKDCINLDFSKSIFTDCRLKNIHNGIFSYGKYNNCKLDFREIKKEDLQLIESTFTDCWLLLSCINSHKNSIYYDIKYDLSRTYPIVTLHGSKFINCKIILDCIDIDMSSCTFTNCQIFGSALFSKLDNTKFENCDLGVDLRGSSIKNFVNIKNES